MGPNLSEGLVKSGLRLWEYRIGRQWAMLHLPICSLTLLCPREATVPTHWGGD